MLGSRMQRGRGCIAHIARRRPTWTGQWRTIQGGGYVQCESDLGVKGCFAYCLPASPSPYQFLHNLRIVLFLEWLAGRRRLDRLGEPGRAVAIDETYLTVKNKLAAGSVVAAPWARKPFSWAAWRATRRDRIPDLRNPDRYEAPLWRRVYSQGFRGALLPPHTSPSGARCGSTSADMCSPDASSSRTPCARTPSSGAATANMSTGSYTTGGGCSLEHRGNRKCSPNPKVE